MTLSETLNTKVIVNELIFLLVTHTTYSDARFDSYGILNSGQGAENFLDRLNDQVLRAQDTRILASFVYGFRRQLNHISNVYSYA
jgi:hypothetical protein